MLSSECVSTGKVKNILNRRGKNRAHHLDVASVTLYHLSYATLSEYGKIGNSFELSSSKQILPLQF